MKNSKEIIITVAIIAALVPIYFWLCGVGLKPNEIGDYLAGFLTPATLLWVVLGYRQQAVELRQNTQALELQVQELRESVDAQNRQAESIAANTAHVQRDVFLQLAGQIICQLEAHATYFYDVYDPARLKDIQSKGRGAILIKMMALNLKDDKRAQASFWRDINDYREEGSKHEYAEPMIREYRRDYLLLLAEAEKADMSGTLKNFFEQSAYGEFYRAIEGLQ